MRAEVWTITMTSGGEAPAQHNIHYITAPQSTGQQVANMANMRVDHDIGKFITYSCAMVFIYDLFSEDIKDTSHA